MKRYFVFIFCLLLSICFISCGPSDVNSIITGAPKPGSQPASGEPTTVSESSSADGSTSTHESGSTPTPSGSSASSATPSKAKAPTATLTISKGDEIEVSTSDGKNITIKNITKNTSFTTKTPDNPNKSSAAATLFNDKESNYTIKYHYGLHTCRYYIWIGSKNKKLFEEEISIRDAPSPTNFKVTYILN